LTCHVSVGAREPEAEGPELRTIGGRGCAAVAIFTVVAAIALVGIVTYMLIRDRVNVDDRLDTIQHALEKGVPPNWERERLDRYARCDDSVGPRLVARYSPAEIDSQSPLPALSTALSATGWTTVINARSPSTPPDQPDDPYLQATRHFDVGDDDWSVNLYASPNGNGAIRLRTYPPFDC
jgi:hypothetical protein